jgi:hypothetical protein
MPPVFNYRSGYSSMPISGFDNGAHLLATCQRFVDDASLGAAQIGRAMSSGVADLHRTFIAYGYGTVN